LIKLLRTLSQPVTNGAGLMVGTPDQQGGIIKILHSEVVLANDLADIVCVRIGPNTVQT